MGEPDGGKLRISVPKSAISLGLNVMRKTIKKKAKFDINELRPVDYVERCFSPCMFAHGAEDKFILPHHSEDLHSLYAGEKSFSLIPEQDHNSVRPRAFLDKVAMFFANALLCFEGSPPAGGVQEEAGHCVGLSLGSAEEHIPGAVSHAIADAATAADLLQRVMRESENSADVALPGEEPTNYEAAEEEALRRAIALSLMDVQETVVSEDEAVTMTSAREAENGGVEVAKKHSKAKKRSGKKSTRERGGKREKKGKGEKRERGSKREKKERRDKSKGGSEADESAMDA